MSLFMHFQAKCPDFGERRRLGKGWGKGLFFGKMKWDLLAFFYFSETLCAGVNYEVQSRGIIIHGGARMDKDSGQQTTQDTKVSQQTAKIGANDGGMFWDCPDFARCRTMHLRQE
jgi:hypothetical protein